MSVPTWPTSLPRPMRRDWQAQVQDPRLSKSAETGPPAYRRRWSNTARLVQMTVDVSRDGKAEFERFVMRTTEHAALPFYMPDPTTDGWPLTDTAGVPLLTSEGQPLLASAMWLCLFDQPFPTETIIGNRFRMAFAVAVLP